MFAFFGILIPSASSTERTDASACTPVQTPQIRSVNAHASRGSRPLRITSRPRHIVPVDTALRMTLSLSTLTSMRRCPSMRVIGSTTMRLPLLSSVKPWVWMIAMLFLHLADLVVARLAARLLDRAHRGMRGDRCAGDAATP